MKQFILSLLGTAFLLSSSLFAQSNTSYKVLHDGPPNPTLNINLEYFGLDMGVKNIDGASFNVGTHGFFEPVDGIGAQWNLKRSFLTFGRVGSELYPANLDLSAGGYFMFQTKTVQKPTKVVLKSEYKGSEYSRNIQGDLVETRTEEVTFMTIPAQRTLQTGFRGGYYMKRGPFNSDDIESESLSSPLYEMSLTSIGIYAGLTRRSLKNVFIDVDGYGVQFNSIGDDYALDLIFVPVNVFRDLNNEGENVSATVKDQLGNFPIGFRIGWYRYQIEKKSRTGKKFGLSASFEGGIKPYQGIFFNGGLGLTLVKQ